VAGDFAAKELVGVIPLARELEPEIKQNQPVNAIPIAKAGRESSVFQGLIKKNQNPWIRADMAITSKDS
jgi:hypothetical protein